MNADRVEECDYAGVAVDVSDRTRHIDEVQADYVLAMQLRRLTKLDVLELRKEADKLDADWSAVKERMSSVDVSTVMPNDMINAKPAVAAVRGRAVGIGLTLLLHCDMVVVAEDALLSAPFINLALAPEAASSMLLPAVLGHQRAFEIFALGEPIDGRTAVAWGLANRAVPADQVDAVAAELAGKLAARAPNSIRKTKRLMRDAGQLWALMQREGEAFGSQMSSPEAMEAFMAFSQKRAPDFSKAG